MGLASKFDGVSDRTCPVNVQSSAPRANMGRVLASFRQRVLALDIRTIRTRVALYELLDEAGQDALDSPGHLPRESWLVDRGPLGYQQLGSAFAAGSHPTLEAGGRSGSARLVWEGKCWTFEPHHEGWVLQEKSLRMPPRLRAETYLGVCAQWALAHPRLAALAPGARLPEQARKTLRRLAVAGARDTSDNERLLLGCAERLIDLVQDEKIDSEVVPMVNAIRGDLAMVRFSDGLVNEAYLLINSIGRFMALATQTDAMSQADRMVLAHLKSAVVTLNQLSQRGEDPND